MTEPISVTLIGFGLAGSVFHAPLITATPGLRLSAIVTSNTQRQAQASREYPDAKIVSKVNDAWGLAHDLVVIASPNRQHAPLAIEALRHGAHVVIDKPVAVTSSQAEEVRAEAQRAQRSVSIFHNRRWDGDFLTLKEILDAGTLGETVRLESRFERWRPVPRENAWRESATAEDGGGLLMDLGSHLVDQVIQLFGLPSSVYAEVDTRRPGASVDDDTFLALEFARGVRAHLWMNTLSKEAGPRFVLRGLRGCYIKYGLDPQEAALRAGQRPLDPQWGKEEPLGWGRLISDDGEGPKETRAGDYLGYYRGVERSLRAGTHPPVTLEQATTVLRVLEAARESDRERKIVDLSYLTQ